MFISVRWREKHHLGQNLLDQLTKTCPGSSSRVTHPRSVSTILTHPVYSATIFLSVCLSVADFVVSVVCLLGGFSQSLQVDVLNGVGGLDELLVEAMEGAANGGR